MRKLNFIILSVILSIFLMGALTGCADSASANELHPPTWIQGTWTEAGDFETWAFTSSTAIWTFGGTSLDFVGLANSGGGELAEPVNTGTQYQFSWDTGGGVIQTYTFNYSSPTEILDANYGNMVLIKQ